MIIHKHLSEKVFKKYHITQISQIIDEYNRGEWMSFEGNTENHIATFRIGNDDIWLVKMTRDFEEKYIVILPEEFFAKYLL